MRLVTIILFVVALAVAGTVAYLVNNWLAQTQAEASKPPEIIEEPKVEVLVAATDLPVGKIIRSEDLRWQSWPEDSVGPDYIYRGGTPETGGAGEGGETTDGGEGEARDTIADIEGAAVRISMIAGETILSSKLFHRGDAGFLSGVLAPGMRAVTVSVNPETGAAGFVLPGDHVDLVVVFDVLDTDEITGETTNRTISETILEDIRVLAIDQAVASRAEPGEEGEGAETVADLAETVTLEVTPNEAQAVAVAVSMGSLRLMLRSAIEGELSEDRLRYSPDFVVSEFLARRIPSSARVLVASRDLPPGEVLNDRDWTWLDMPAQLIEGDWVREGTVELNTLRGALSLASLEAGQPIVPDRLILPSQDGYIPSLLSPGMRAITILLDEARTVSAFIAPGDLVDVIYNYESQDQSEEPIKDTRRFSETLLENVRVLQIDREFDEARGMPSLVPAEPTVTLEVTPEQAETIIVAQSEGTLSLVLRSDEPGDATRLADYTSDFEASRSLVDLIYGLTLPEPPSSVAATLAPPADTATAPSDEEAIDLSEYLDGLSGDSNRSSGQVRVYRSTVPQDLDFSE